MIYGKLYNISWFVIQKGLQFIVWFYSLRICILTSILRITIYTNSYNSVWINIPHLARCTILFYILINLHFYWRAMFILISWRSNWEVTFPRQTFLHLESIAVRYLAGKLHHANAFRLPMAFSNLIWRCKLYYICLHVNDVHLLPFATIWKVVLDAFHNTMQRMDIESLWKFAY